MCNILLCLFSSNSTTSSIKYLDFQKEGSTISCNTSLNLLKQKSMSVWYELSSIFIQSFNLCWFKVIDSLHTEILMFCRESVHYTSPSKTSIAVSTWLIFEIRGCRFLRVKLPLIISRVRHFDGHRTAYHVCTLCYDIANLAV